MSIGELIKNVNVDLNVLGNVKAYKWLEKQSNKDTIKYTSKDFRTNSESKGNREAEALKLLDAYKSNKISTNDVIKAVKKVGGVVNANQLLQWWGVSSPSESKATKRKEQQSEQPFSPVSKDDGGRWISKAESYFFDAVLMAMSEADIKTAQKAAESRIAAEALALIQEQATKEVNPMLEMIKARRAAQLEQEALHVDEENN